MATMLQNINTAERQALRHQRGQGMESEDSVRRSSVTAEGDRAHLCTRTTPAGKETG